MVDCQPPSKMVMVVSSTMAILLPCRYTNETPSMVTTSVLPDFQFLFAWIAAHIWDSILRIWCRVWLTSIQYRRWGRAQPMLCHFAHWSANMPKCASRTKSMTSSSALHSKRSQNQSTAISDDAMVSNMKSCRSCRFWGEKRVVLFMCLQYTVLGSVPILCATLPTGRAAASVYIT